MTKRQELKAARKRGLVDRRTAEWVAPHRHRRTCPACGKTFLARDLSGRTAFCCACCAEAWGGLYDDGKLDRRVARGVEVVLVLDGSVGVVETVPDAERAVVAMEDGRRLTVGPREVERIQHLPVVHHARCRKELGKARLAALRSRPEVRIGPQEGEDGSDGSEE